MQQTMFAHLWRYWIRGSLGMDRSTGASRKNLDTISDNAANAGFVLGREHHTVDAFDLRRVGAIVTKDGQVEETGLGAGVLNDPIESVVWLARVWQSMAADKGRACHSVR